MNTRPIIPSGGFGNRTLPCIEKALVKLKDEYSARYKTLPFFRARAYARSEMIKRAHVEFVAILLVKRCVGQLFHHYHAVSLLKD